MQNHIKFVGSDFWGFLQTMDNHGHVDFIRTLVFRTFACPDLPTLWWWPRSCTAYRSVFRFAVMPFELRDWTLSFHACWNFCKPALSPGSICYSIVVLCSWSFVESILKFCKNPWPPLGCNCLEHNFIDSGLVGLKCHRIFHDIFWIWGLTFSSF